MVDTVKILGSLLGSGVLSKGSGGDVLSNVLGAALGGNQDSEGGAGGLGSLLGSVLGGAQQQDLDGAQQEGGSALTDILGSVLGGSQQDGGGLVNVLAGALGGGSSERPPASGMSGLTDILGSVMGGGGQSSEAGGLGGLAGLGGLLGTAVTKYAQSQASGSDGDAGGLDLSALLGDTSEEDALDQASLMIRAMVAAAKADGHLDDAEKEKLVGKLGDIDEEEAAFLRAEIENDISATDLAQSVPSELAQQVYAVSLMAIDLDTKAEAEYLHELATGLELDLSLANQLHEQLGAPVIYS